MAFERQSAAVAPIALIADGDAFGNVQVSNTAGFLVKQVAYLTATGLPDLPCQVKIVYSSTTLKVGPVDNQIANSKPLDISAYTVAKNAQIGAAQQNKNNITIQDIEKATYSADPIVARRVIPVDEYGDYYNDSNPLPIAFDGTVQIGDVSIVDANTHTPVKVNNDGSINVVVESTPSSNTTTVNKYNEVLSVVGGSETQLVSYTVPAGKQSVFYKAVASGDNIARYDLLINSITQDTLRTYFGGELNAVFDFTTGTDNGLVLNAGDVVVVEVLHNRPYTGNFNARIEVLEIAL